MGAMVSRLMCQARRTAHALSRSMRTAPIKRAMAASLGKIPTASVCPPLSQNGHSSGSVARSLALVTGWECRVGDHAGPRLRPLLRRAWALWWDDRLPKNTHRRYADVTQSGSDEEKR